MTNKLITDMCFSGVVYIKAFLQKVEQIGRKEVNDRSVDYILKKIGHEDRRYYDYSVSRQYFT